MLKISKRYCLYSFHLISPKFYEDIGYHDGIQAVTFFGNQPSFKKIVAHWNFNMWINGKILKCAISWRRMIVEPNGWKFAIRDPRNYICRVFSCLILWVQFVVIQCTFLKMACAWKTTHRRVKQTEIWQSGTLVTHMWGVFDLVGSRVICIWSRRWW